MDLSLTELRELVMDREAWRGVIHGAAKGRTWLSNLTEMNRDTDTENRLMDMAAREEVEGGMDEES